MDCYAHLATIEPPSGTRPSVLRGAVTTVPQPCARLSIVTVSGTLRAPLTSDVSRTVDAHLRRGERHLLLDLSELPDIDAAGVGELVRALNAAHAYGGSLRIARANRYVRQLLQVAGVFTLMTGGATT